MGKNTGVLVAVYVYVILDSGEHGRVKDRVVYNFIILYIIFLN